MIAMMILIYHHNDYECHHPHDGDFIGNQSKSFEVHWLLHSVDDDDAVDDYDDDYD